MPTAKNKEKPDTRREIGRIEDPHAMVQHRLPQRPDVLPVEQVRNNTRVVVQFLLDRIPQLMPEPGLERHREPHLLTIEDIGW